MSKQKNRFWGILILIAGLLISATILTANVVCAADLMLDTAIKRTEIAVDKNGNEYIRLIVPIEKNLNGISYTTDSLVMAPSFSDPQLLAAAKSLKPGDQVKMIVQSGEYNGRTTYRLLALP